MVQLDVIQAFGTASSIEVFFVALSGGTFVAIVNFVAVVAFVVNAIVDFVAVVANCCLCCVLFFLTPLGVPYQI